MQLEALNVVPETAADAGRDPTATCTNSLSEQISMDDLQFQTVLSLCTNEINMKTSQPEREFIFKAPWIQQ